MGPRIAETVNFDEAAVPDYQLPDPLVRADGSPLPDAAAWFGERRAEILELFRSQVYGHSPEPPAPVRAVLREADPGALGGAALRMQWSVELTPGGRAAPLELLLFLPTRGTGRAPVVLGLNFFGNHTIHPDPQIHLTGRWVPDRPDGGSLDHRATEGGRGQSRSRWPVEQILRRGYGIATAYCGDLEPDHEEGSGGGIRGCFRADPEPTWGAISAWAWGLSRALEVLAREPAVHAGRVIAFGHSRLGKAALWAAAQDERFAAAISNDSGCMGAAISRRRFGETVEFINLLFPHWFAPAFKSYSGREDELPIDQHMLLALLAPRPLYVASAEDDHWADPRGEFLATREAARVYRFLGVEGISAQVMPPVSRSLPSRVGYHVRPGKHDVKEYDWMRFLDFADRHVSH